MKDKKKSNIIIAKKYGQLFSLQEKLNIYILSIKISFKTVFSRGKRKIEHGLRNSSENYLRL
jgi:hypothetical protein